MPAKPKPYFRIIMTRAPKEEEAIAEHGQKLNNYLKYGQPWKNSELKQAMIPLNYEIEVESQDTATTEKNNWFIITTTLCCHDEREETEGYGG